MKEQIKNILLRRGALHVLNGVRFYTEESVIDALNEALRIHDVSDTVCDCQTDNYCEKCAEKKGVNINESYMP